MPPGGTPTGSGPRSSGTLGGAPGDESAGRQPVAGGGPDLLLPDLQIGREIARGGFGVVYEAHQTALNRTVAVKLLLAEVHDEKVRLRFERECTAMGLLSDHPNIVTVFEAGFSPSGQPFILMDFMTGGSLADIVEADGPMDWREVLSTTVKLASALETAHRSGVLHRDVKPENVLLSTYGEPELGDFGIARLAGGPETRTDTLTASIAHVAPELLAGSPPSVATDLYALGSTCYVLLSGRPAFLRDTDESIVPALTRITSEPVPDLRAGGAPEEVAALVERLMAKDPAERFASALDVAVHVQDVQLRLGLPVAPIHVPGEPSFPEPSYPDSAFPDAASPEAGDTERVDPPAASAAAAAPASATGPAAPPPVPGVDDAAARTGDGLGDVTAPGHPAAPGQTTAPGHPTAPGQTTAPGHPSAPVDPTTGEPTAPVGPSAPVDPTTGEPTAPVAAPGPPGSPGDPTGPMPVTRRRGRTPVVLAVAACVAVAAVAAVLVLGRGATDPGESGDVAEPADSGTGTAVDDMAVGEDGGQILDVTQMATQISEIRGLALRGNLDARRYPPEEYSALVREYAGGSQRDDLAEQGQVLAALRLIPRDTDYPELTRDLWEEQLNGFYDESVGRAHVRGTGQSLSALERKVLADELMIALLDSAFDLQALHEDAANADADRAVDALVKGDTFLSSTVWAERFLTTEEQTQADSDLSLLPARVGRSVSRAMLGEFLFPFVAGEDFARALFAEGGVATLDAAYEDPPTTTEQIIHPDKYLAREPAIDVAGRADPPGDGWGELVRRTFGEQDLQQLLAELGEEQALPAAAGWGGGTLVAWTRGEETAVAVWLEMDTPEDGAELCEAVPVWYVLSGGAPDEAGGFSSPDDAMAVSCDGAAVRFAVAPDGAVARTLLE